MIDSVMGKAMFQLHEQAAQQVAADSRSAVLEIDTACIAQFRLAATAVETVQSAGLPAGQSQRLLRTFHSSIGKIVDGRGDLVSAIGQLQVIHKHSNIAEVDLGCNGPWRFFTTGEASENGVVASIGLESR